MTDVAEPAADLQPASEADADVQVEETAAAEERVESQQDVETDAPESSTGKGSSMQKRMDELTRKRHDAERRALDVERERDYWRQQVQQQQQQPQPQPEPEPEPLKTLDDFDYDEGKYHQYMSERYGADIEKRSQAAAQRVIEEANEQRAREQRFAAHQERERAFEAEAPDYKAVAHTAEAGEFINPLADHIISMSDGPAVAYYLAKNPAEARQVAQMAPLHAAIELGRISAKVQKPPAEKVSDTPPPPAKLEGKGKPGPKQWQDMSDAEFANWRRKGGTAKGRVI